MISVNHHPLICENISYPRTQHRHRQIPTHVAFHIWFRFFLLLLLFGFVFPDVDAMHALGILTSVLFMYKQTSYHNINKVLHREWNRKKLIIFFCGIGISALRMRFDFFHRCFNWHASIDCILPSIKRLKRIPFCVCCFGMSGDKLSENDAYCVDQWTNRSNERGLSAYFGGKYGIQWFQKPKWDNLIKIFT